MSKESSLSSSYAHGHGAEHHECFGCGHKIESNGWHIHVGINELERMGWNAPPIPGMDDLKFPFCEPCTVPTKREGWTLEAHGVRGR